MSGTEDLRLRRGWEIARGLVSSLRSSETIRETYPALLGGGVLEGALHSYMLSALLLLGDRMGYSAVCDSPVFDKMDNLLLGEGSKRPDSVWLERGTETVRVLIEFERYTTNSLAAKTRNLLMMANSCIEDIELLVLMYWTLGVRDGSDLHAAYGLARRGFSSNDFRVAPASCPLMVLETLTRRIGDRRTLDGFIVRQFVYGGEDKQYIVNELNT
jgi:hypothetical protein